MATTQPKDCKRAGSLVWRSQHALYRSTIPIYPYTQATQTPSPRSAFLIYSNFYTFSPQGNETHTFSDHLLNEAFVGYNRIEGHTPDKGLSTV